MEKICKARRTCSRRCNCDTRPQRAPVGTQRALPRDGHKSLAAPRGLHRAELCRVPSGTGRSHLCCRWKLARGSTRGHPAGARPRAARHVAPGALGTAWSHASGTPSAHRSARRGPVLTVRAFLPSCVGLSRPLPSCAKGDVPLRPAAGGDWERCRCGVAKSGTGVN